MRAEEKSWRRKTISYYRAPTPPAHLPASTSDQPCRSDGGAADARGGVCTTLKKDDNIDPFKKEKYMRRVGGKL